MTTLELELRAKKSRTGEYEAVLLTPSENHVPIIESFNIPYDTKALVIVSSIVGWATSFCCPPT